VDLRSMLQCRPSSADLDAQLCEQAGDCKPAKTAAAAVMAMLADMKDH